MFSNGNIALLPKHSSNWDIQICVCIEYLLHFYMNMRYTFNRCIRWLVGWWVGWMHFGYNFVSGFIGICTKNNVVETARAVVIADWCCYCDSCWWCLRQLDDIFWSFSIITIAYSVTDLFTLFFAHSQKCAYNLTRVPFSHRRLVPMSSQKYSVCIIRLEIVSIEFLAFMESGVWFLALVHFHSNTFIALYRLYTHAFLIICFFVHLWKLCMLYIYVYMYVCVQLVPKQCWCGNNFTITILVSQSCDLILGFLIRFCIGITHVWWISLWACSKNQTIVLKCMLHCHWNIYCKSTRSNCDGNKR